MFHTFSYLAGCSLCLGYVFQARRPGEWDENPHVKGKNVILLLRLYLEVRIIFIKPFSLLFLLYLTALVLFCIQIKLMSNAGRSGSIASRFLKH